jgi:hypothetical protein
MVGWPLSVTRLRRRAVLPARQQRLVRIRLRRHAACAMTQGLRSRLCSEVSERGAGDSWLDFFLGRRLRLAAPATVNSSCRMIYRLKRLQRDTVNASACAHIRYL